MAQVTAQPATEERIDRYLAYLLREWSGLPVIAVEWESWDLIRQLDFIVEWDIKRDRLFQLEDWNEQGLLTPMQEASYRQLLELMDQHRPILDRLLAD